MKTPIIARYEMLNDAYVDQVKLPTDAVKILSQIWSNRIGQTGLNVSGNEIPDSLIITSTLMIQKKNSDYKISILDNYENKYNTFSLTKEEFIQLKKSIQNFS
jgi:hypothetical protein